MVQTKEECLQFLNGARDTLDELALLEEQEKQLNQTEERLEESLENEKRLMTDTIQKTVKNRREEIRSTYEKEISKIHALLKKARSRREKARSEGVKGRIQEETDVFHREIQDLKAQLKMMMRQNHVPGYCQSALYYRLYFPRHVMEYLQLFVYILILFLAVPYGVYLLIPERKTLHLVLIYIADILLFGGSYIALGNRTKLLYMETLREGRKIQDQILANRKRIRKITSGIRKDRNESLYNLEKYDDEIARLQQELTDMATKQKDALNAFETVTRNILADEIEHNHKAKLDQLQQEHQQTNEELRQITQQVKEKRLYVTEHYGTWLGREFMDSQRIAELCGIVQEGMASNVSEAITVYQERKNVVVN